MPKRLIASLALSLALTGCGGQYILTVPDQVAAAGGQSVAVARLQRNDFFVLAPPIEGAALRFRVEEQGERAAYTDRLGYAGAAVPVPAQEGLYTLRVDHMDREGDEAHATAPVYVWNAQTPVVAVDLDALRLDAARPAEAAAQALRKLAARPVRILYLTDRRINRHARIHRRLAELNLPDGPVLLWQREFWHIVYVASLIPSVKIPTVKIETRLVSQLAGLRQTLPKLQAGIAGSNTACRAFLAADLKCITLVPTRLDDPRVTRAESWDAAVQAVP